MSNIIFGTDGWRAIISNDFNCHNISRVIIAVSKWLKNKYTDTPIKVVIGNDCRFMGRQFSNLIAGILVKQEIQVILSSNNFVSTPMVSLATRHYNAHLGIIVTASHNPYYYSGIKLKGNYGGPLDELSVKEIESLIPQDIDMQIQLQLNSNCLDNNPLITTKDLESLYIENIENNIDTNAINKHSEYLVYDLMYGAGQNAIKQILPKSTLVNAEVNPNFGYSAPEPIEKNLIQLQNLIINKSYKCAIALDGDADRLAIFDEKGCYISSHKIIMLLILYLYEYKGLKGDVISTFSCTDKIQKLCNIYGINHTVTKVGFKYICQLMTANPKQYMLGGEESGGIALNHYLCERDGIFISLNIIALMIESKKTLSELIDNLYDKVGYFSTGRIDLSLTKQKEEILKKYINKDFKEFFQNKVIGVEYLDGIKFRFANESWVMLRLSGTEPLLRIYYEANTNDESGALINETKSIIEKLCVC
ncbi:MAG: phosphoglucomutase/phosphomannomutase family protein [Solitalea-like symbiont of Tyrophagus putrescentiae]